MKKIILILLAFVGVISANAQQLNLNTGELRMVTPTGYWAEPTPFACDYDSIQKRFVIYGRQTRTFFFASVTQFRVNGVVVPLTANSIKDSLIAYKSVGLNSGTTGGGAGATSTSTLQQIQIDTNAIGNNLIRFQTKILQDSLAKLIAKNGGVSDSSFIKRNIDTNSVSNSLLRTQNKTLLDSSTAFLVKRSLDSLSQIRSQLKAEIIALKTLLNATITNTNDSLQKLNNTARLLATENTLALLNSNTTNLEDRLLKIFNRLDTIKKYNSYIEDVVTNQTNGLQKMQISNGINLLTINNDGSINNKSDTLLNDRKVITIDNLIEIYKILKDSSVYSNVKKLFDSTVIGNALKRRQIDSLSKIINTSITTKDTTNGNATTLRQIRDKVATFGVNANTFQNITTASTTVTTTNALKVILTNIGNGTATFTYNGRLQNLATGKQWYIECMYDWSSNKYTPIGSLVVSGNVSNVEVDLINKQ